MHGSPAGVYSWGGSVFDVMGQCPLYSLHSDRKTASSSVLRPLAALMFTIYGMFTGA